ncbi:DUF1501 domain-containing protein [Consotaella aegiceratis]|uniref:DUF1501 domain-containing protein n=1 Tax=Consotaella aegiceratis TaxID=3097961 RepID=UPI002F3F83F8
MSSNERLLDGLICPDRRAFVAGAGAFIAWANMPRHAFAGRRDPRFVAVVLRGAMDGLAAVPPVGDPDYAALRGEWDLGAGNGVIGLDDFFALNDAMPRLADRYRQRQALIVHACATPYRDRSHFDGQDVLESGMTGPHGSETGWLNRAAAVLPKGDRVRPASGLAVGATVPLILRGQAPTLAWSPPRFKPIGADTADRLASLYGERDPVLARVFQAGLMTDALAEGGSPSQQSGGIKQAFRQLAEGAGRLLAADDGPRVAAISYDGWDTHIDEGADDGKLANLLGALDEALDALAGSLGPDVWKDTVVAVMTEFGRTARVNGNEGTDHGTATTAFLVGGAVKGGRILADWPGLKDADLYENRDLRPTTDLRAVLKGVLRDHLGIEERALTGTVFPDSIGIRPLDGLVA